MAEVVLKNISKRWDKFTAVQSLDLTIANGEFLVLVGPSGCGKSTTLRMIAGLEDPTEGEIRINGVDVTEKEPKDRGIAMVFQNYALYPHMTVGENIGFGLKVKGVPRAEMDREIKAAAEMLGISSLLDRRPKALSGGQRQRVALGRAIVRKPAVFLMDEPLSNLDAKLRVVMRAELIKLHQKLASTFVYVTHDQTEAMTMGSRIVVMKDGVVQQVGSPDEIYHHPKNVFVAGFIGSPPMNFVNGFIDGAAGGKKFVGKSFTMPLPCDLDWSTLTQGREVTLGIRPEHMTFNEARQDDADAFECEVVEHIGASVTTHASHPNCGSMMLSFSSRLKAPKPGDRIKLLGESDCAHLFDAKTGESLTWPGNACGKREAAEATA